MHAHADLARPHRWLLDVRQMQDIPRRAETLVIGHSHTVSPCFVLPCSPGLVWALSLLHTLGRCQAMPRLCPGVITGALNFSHIVARKILAEARWTSSMVQGSSPAKTCGYSRHSGPCRPHLQP